MLGRVRQAQGDTVGALVALDDLAPLEAHVVWHQPTTAYVGVRKVVECWAGSVPLGCSTRQRVTRLSGASWPPAQAVPERMDGGHHLPNARVERWTSHQVAGTRCYAAA